MTAPETFLDGRVTLHCGDCLDMLPTLQENSVDSVVTDPPYELTQANRRNPPPYVDGSPYSRHRLGVNGDAKPVGGFMGKEWDGTGIAHSVDLWREVYRVLKPGGHLIAFGGTRTYHRMACAIEDAGFEVRDLVAWMFGQGFPKSLNVALAYEQRLCERKVRGDRTLWVYRDDGTEMARVPPFRDDDANKWAGWGTAFKPALEPICIARKPLSESTVAANVLKWGTGALNIDGCRVSFENDRDDPATNPLYRAKNGYKNTSAPDTNSSSYSFRADGGPDRNPQPQGRWPANVIHDGSEEVAAAFPDNLSSGTGAIKKVTGAGTQANAYGKENRAVGTPNVEYGDSGSAARFFYTAKADADDRLGSKHPTVKPLDLMQYLVRLVTPPRGIILDCFAGTGTAGEAAYREGCSAILIEREPEYQDDIRRRMVLVLAGPDERLYATIKAKGLTENAGPLFGEPMVASE